MIYSTDPFKRDLELEPISRCPTPNEANRFVEPRAHVVVGALLGRSDGHQQQRPGSIENLVLFDRQDDRAAGRVQVQPDDGGDLFDGLRPD